MNLKEIRNEYEKGLKTVLFFNNMEQESNILVIARDDKNRFYCNRYFEMRGEWHASIDVHNATAQDCLDWLASHSRLFAGVDVEINQDFDVDVHVQADVGPYPFEQVAGGNLNL